MDTEKSLTPSISKIIIAPKRVECGDIAQLGERGVRNAEVGGSSPPISTPQMMWLCGHIAAKGFAGLSN